MVKNPIKLARLLIHWVVSILTSPALIYFAGEILFRLKGMRAKGNKTVISQFKRVLVVRLDRIGDVVLTTPFLRELRINLPDAWISLVVNPAVYNLVEQCPYVNEVLIYDWNAHGRPVQLRRHVRALKFAWKHLWRRRFDMAILPRWDTDFYNGTFLGYFSGATWRVGYSENVNETKSRQNNNYNRLLTHIMDEGIPKHEVLHNLDMIRFLSGTVQENHLELWVSDEDKVFARKILAEHGVQPGELVVGLSPFSGDSPLKQWPVGHLIELIYWLRMKYKSRILVIGGPSEEALGWEFEEKLGYSVIINVIGRTTLRQMAALLECCHLYVGNDAGPMHVAAAMGIPVVALFGSSCHHRFGPWGNNHEILWLGFHCSPCSNTYHHNRFWLGFHCGPSSNTHHHNRCRNCIFDQPYCMVNINVEQVKGAVNHILANTSFVNKGDN